RQLQRQRIQHRKCRDITNSRELLQRTLVCEARELLHPAELAKRRRRRVAVIVKDREPGQLRKLRDGGKQARRTSERSSHSQFAQRAQLPQLPKIQSVPFTNIQTRQIHEL